ncbi:MAG: hypothetical protein EBZ48_05505 [Proteobacteria bacterium]|nr:hypothetical protein [Pseudomonadota bacterium]
MKSILRDYLDEEGICRLLEGKKLLGDTFLYSAIPAGAEDFTRVNGTYCSERLGDGRKPLNQVFCCELATVGGRRTVVEVGAPERGLLDYLKQNGGDTSAVIAVYRRAELQQPYIATSAAQFEFKDFSKASTALVALVVIENFAG